MGKRNLSLKQLKLNELRTRHFSRILAIVLTLLLTMGVLLYWWGSLSLWGLFFWLVGLLVVAFLFLFGVRMARRQGFIDGFRNGRDQIEIPKKKT